MNRDDYMSGRVTHQEYYTHLADLLGRDAVERIVLRIASREELKAALATDEHLNNIPLPKWDSQAPSVEALVSAKASDVMAVSWNGQPLKPKTYCWSLGESGCVLKAAARRMAEELAP